jgi:hypothetical protein
LRDLQGVGEPGYIVVTQGSNENLCLMLEAAKSLAVDNTVSVTLKSSAYRARLFGFEPAL